MSINQVTIVGYTGTDPERPKHERAPVGFTIATKRSYKDRKSGDWIEETDWHNIKVWARSEKHLAMLMSVKKGSIVAVEGSITYSNVEQDDGTKRYYTNIKVRRFDVISRKRPLASSVVGELGDLEKHKDLPKEDNQQKSTSDFDDEIPF